jgi:hypothetical protein
MFVDWHWLVALTACIVTGVRVLRRACMQLWQLRQQLTHEVLHSIQASKAQVVAEAG